jgi:hypothetical protein
MRNTTIRNMQGELARCYGVDEFVYHHYWFYEDNHPGPSLHAPLMDILQDGHPNIPFCLHWVAENWTTMWHRKQGNETQQRDPDAAAAATGKEKEGQLLQQQFFPTDSSDLKLTVHYQWLRSVLHSGPIRYNR